jgi:hypothetical protein
MIPMLTRQIKIEYICLECGPQSAIFKVIILFFKLKSFKKPQGSLQTDNLQEKHTSSTSILSANMTTYVDQSEDITWQTKPSVV